MAVFDTGPGVDGSVTMRVIVADAPFASVPRVQVTVVVPLQLPWLGVAETNDVPAGSASVTTTFAAALGPAFDTAIVYVSEPPVPYGPACGVLAMERSALATTFVFAVALLLPGVGSVEADETVAVLDRAAGAAGALTLSVKTLGPTGADARVQLTVPPAPTAGVVHAQPAAAASDAKVAPAGIVSVNTALMAAFGPLFVTVMV